MNKSKNQPVTQYAPDGTKEVSSGNCLIIAFVQLQDERKATRALNKLGLPCYHLSSTGAFLERKNAVLLISLNDQQTEKAAEAIRLTCHERTEYVSTPLEGAPLPIPLTTPIQVGGATIFILPVERFEEL
jgi:uncharacterized protein YaaQ